jgi:hypothetical protein
MSEQILYEHIRELCDVLQQLSQRTADGPCWCLPGVAHLAHSHTTVCARAQSALAVGHAIQHSVETAPGYGFGV